MSKFLTEVNDDLGKSFKAETNFLRIGLKALRRAKENGAYLKVSKLKGAYTRNRKVDSGGELFKSFFDELEKDYVKQPVHIDELKTRLYDHVGREHNIEKEKTTKAHHSSGRLHHHYVYSYSKGDLDRAAKSVEKKHGKNTAIVWKSVLSEITNTPGLLTKSVGSHPFKPNYIGHFRLDYNFNYNGERALWLEEMQCDLIKTAAEFRKGGYENSILNRKQMIKSVDFNQDKPVEPTPPEYIDHEAAQRNAEEAIEANNQTKAETKRVYDLLAAGDDDARFEIGVKVFAPPEADGVEFRSEEGGADQLNGAIENHIDQGKKDELVNTLKQQVDTIAGSNEDVRHWLQTVEERNDQLKSAYERAMEDYEEDRESFEGNAGFTMEGFEGWVKKFAKNWHIFGLKQVLVEASKKGCKYFCLTDTFSAQSDARGKSPGQYKEYYQKLAKKLGMTYIEGGTDTEDRNNFYPEQVYRELSDGAISRSEADQRRDEPEQVSPIDGEELEESLLSESPMNFWVIEINKKTIQKLSSLHEGLFSQDQELIKERLDALQDKN